MNRIRILVEGDTEASFVNLVLYPEFAQKEIFLFPTLFRKQHKGSFSYHNCQKRILNSIRQDSSTYVTIFVDYYKLHKDWPGQLVSQTCKNYKDKAQKIEQALLEDIAAQMGDNWNPAQFIPYIQMHEFETLLFSSTQIMAESIGINDLNIQLQKVRESFTCPEEINDNEETHPSMRILKFFSGYNKVDNGIKIARKIGIRKIRQECPHFNEWIEKLEGIGK
ncbi:MAG: DUF4276 family protein [Sedimentisphaerales bacterium]|nr:DUF4276 family protein [Sedimentisphaerales bacterium]